MFGGVTYVFSTDNVCGGGAEAIAAKKEEVTPRGTLYSHLSLAVNTEIHEQTLFTKLSDIL